MECVARHTGIRHFTYDLIPLACVLCLGQSALSAAPAEQSLQRPRPKADETLHYGPLDIGVGGQGSVVYDDNIFIQPDKTSDIVGTVSPGIRLGLGDYRDREGNSLGVRYAPSFIFFADHSDQNSIDQDAALNGRWRPGVWTFTLSQAYQKLSEPEVDVGNRVDRDIYSTDLSAAYEISPKTSAELAGRQRIADYHVLSSRNEWEALAWLDYKLTPRLRLGVGGSVGWLDVEDSPNQMYERAQLRADYTLTEVVDLRGSAGVERREYQHSDSAQLEGVFSLGATYSPFATTSFTLDAFRTPRASVRFRDQNYILTGFHGGVRKTFSEIYALTLTAGYEHADYTATSANVNATRRDDYFMIRPGFDWTFRERLIVGVFYIYRQNISTEQGFEFGNHQVGLRVALKF